MRAPHQRWHEFAAAKPGTRFEREYECRRGADPAAWKRVLGVLLGVALIVVGIVQLAVPGPGLLVIGIGAAALARESRAIARWLDRGEVALRRQAAGLRQWWQGLAGVGRVALVVVTLAAVAALGVAALRLLLSR